jgi:hypothetical protein
MGDVVGAGLAFRAPVPVGAPIPLSHVVAGPLPGGT